MCNCWTYAGPQHGIFGIGTGKKIDVAAIYALPVEQQWISRIHKALKAAEARGEITYSFLKISSIQTMNASRDYTEQGKFDYWRSFWLERASRKVAKDYPDTAFSWVHPSGPLPRIFYFDNWIHDLLSGMVAARPPNDRIGMVGGYAIPVNRLMQLHGRRTCHESQCEIMVNFIDGWYDPPKAERILHD